MSDGTHLGTTTPKARKRHRCYLCRQFIEPGETYVRHSGIADGKARSWAHHPECDAATADWDMDDWECFASGELERPAKAAGAEKGGGA